MFSDFVELIPNSIPDPITEQQYLHSVFERVQILSFPMRDQYYHGSVVGIVFDTKKRTPFTRARAHTHTHAPHILRNNLNQRYTFINIFTNTNVYSLIHPYREGTGRTHSYSYKTRVPKHLNHHMCRG